jgi:hypothetical protein
MFTADKAWGGRSKHSYAWKRLLDLRTRLSFGSDAPVESPNPFVGLQAALTRRNSLGDPGEEGWHPSQRLSLTESLQAFTAGPAYLAGMESNQGKLAPGFLADLIVLDENPYEINMSELDRVKPTATMVGGNWVWQR